MKGKYENNGNSYFMEEQIKNKETNRKRIIYSKIALPSKNLS